MYRFFSIFFLLLFTLFFGGSCHKQYQAEVVGRLLHPNNTPVSGQGLIIKGDNVFGKDNSRYLTDKTHGGYNTDGSGEFRLFVKIPRDGKAYLNAIQEDGTLKRISEVFYIKKGEIVNLGDIIVSWN